VKPSTFEPVQEAQLKTDEPRVRLAATHPGGYHPGRPFVVRAIWLVVEALVLLNPVIVSYPLKRAVLRLFGATIGKGVMLKPGVHVKYPWRLTVGDDCWLGERAWIDNMEDVVLGSDVVISQGAYLCTGNHDWADPAMPLAPRPIRVEHGAWVGAFAKVAPGTTVGTGSVLALGAVALADTEPWGVYAGNPAARVGTRVLDTAS
jgi:putative colanic acid biosynthesis acetyltransferase WcaF